MSKRINVNPDHYKVAGRERPGGGILHDRLRRTFAQEQAAIERWQITGPGPSRPKGSIPRPKDREVVPLPRPKRSTKARGKKAREEPRKTAPRRKPTPERKRAGRAKKQVSGRN